MASQVLSGTSNPTYTNNTGQNVRVIINYMDSAISSPTGSAISIRIIWGTASATTYYAKTIGRNLAFNSGWTSSSTSATSAANNMLMFGGSTSTGVPWATSDEALPTEIMLAPGQTFSATCGDYNIVIIPEAG